MTGVPDSFPLLRARVMAHTSRRTTVVSVTGEVDACNAEHVGDRIRRFVIPGNTLVVDLSSLDFLGVPGIRYLFALADECAAADVDWVLVTSHSVRRLLRVADRSARLPAVNSMAEVCRRLAGAHPGGALRLLS